jgi:hypothetical protein
MRGSKSEEVAIDYGWIKPAVKKKRAQRSYEPFADVLEMCISFTHAAFLLSVYAASSRHY